MADELTDQQALQLWRLIITGDQPMKSSVQLDPKPRDAMRRLGYIDYEKRGRADHIVVTDKGWQWASENTQPTFNRNVKVSDELACLIKRMGAYMDQSGVSLYEVLRAPEGAATAPSPLPSASPEDAIRAAYLAVGGGRYNERIRLADLRPALDGFDRDVVDKTLLDMQHADRAVLMSIDDPLDRRPEDEEAAVRIGSDRRHLLVIRGA